jgi:tRNA threonylcarbamoyladenosine biosynthesis protein TsaB
MRVLSIDTSQPQGSVAVSKAGGTEKHAYFGTGSSHLVDLSTAVDALLKESGFDIAAIDRVALVSGPGSFTGLRIGLAFVKGLFAARAVEVVTMPSVELLALGGASEHHRGWQRTGARPRGATASTAGPTGPAMARICPMIDARRDEVYAALYVTDGRYDLKGRAVPRVRAEVGPLAVSPLEFLTSLAICPTLFVGSGARRYRDMVRERFGDQAVFGDEDRPSTVLLGRVAPALECLPAEQVPGLEPFYIRPSGAVLKPLRKIQNDG